MQCEQTAGGLTAGEGAMMGRNKRLGSFAILPFLQKVRDTCLTKENLRMKNILVLYFGSFYAFVASQSLSIS